MLAGISKRDSVFHPNGLWRNSPQSVAALRFIALASADGSSFTRLKSLINGL